MSTIYCMNCGIELEEGTRFCPECGSPTLLGAGLADYEGMAQVVCPSCKTLNDSAEHFCTNCGTSLRHATTASNTPAADMHFYRSHHEGDTTSPQKRKMILGAVAGCAALIICIGLASFFGVLRRADDQKAAEIAAEQAAAQEEEMGAAGTEVRAGLASYSWEELGIIGKEINRCATRDDALALAREYHLVDDGNAMMVETKDVVIEGVGTVAMRLADVYHDDLANGEGKAGLTLIASNLTIEHVMNSSGDIAGGWESSELRSWLNGEVYQALDEGLRTSIVAVDKHTNNVGTSTDVSCVTSTFDYLWIPSMVEVMGTIDWTWPSDPGNSAGYNEITNAEGAQYACFAAMNVVGLESNEGLALQGNNGTQVWWQRTCAPSGAPYFRGVSTSGDPTSLWAPSSNYGVPLSFCL